MIDANDEIYRSELQKAQQIDDPWLRGRWIGCIAIRMIKQNKNKIREALEILAKIDEPTVFYDACREIAEELVATNSVEEAIAIILTWIDKEKVSALLRRIVQQLAKIGSYELALQLSQHISSSGWRLWAIKDIIETMAGAGKIDEAMSALKYIDVDEALYWAISAIAYNVPRQQTFQSANRIFGELLDVARNMHDQECRKHALSCIGEALVLAGMYNDAIRLAKQEGFKGAKWFYVAELLQKQKYDKEQLKDRIIREVPEHMRKFVEHFLNELGKKR